MRLVVSIIPPAPLVVGSTTDDEPTAKPLVKIVVPIEPHQTFEDLWRLVAQRYTRRSFSEKKRPADVYFSKFTDLLGADIFIADTIGSLFREDAPIQDLQLNLILHEAWRPGTIPLDSEVRPRDFQPPAWESLSPGQQDKVLRRRSEEIRYGRTLDQLDADFPVTSREPDDRLGEATVQTVDTDGFKVPTRPVKTSVHPTAVATQTHYSSPHAAKTQVPSSSTSPENHRRNPSAVKPSHSEERQRASSGPAPPVAKRHSAHPPTPISNEAPASSQIPPVSAQRPPLSNPAPPTRPRSPFQRHGSDVGHQVDVQITDPIQDDSEDDESDEYGPVVHLDDATLHHIDSLSQEHLARSQQSKFGDKLCAVRSSHSQSQAAIQTSSQSSPPNISPMASQNSAFDQMLQSSQPAPSTRGSKRKREPKWTESEDGILLDHPNLVASKFAKLLRRRTGSSIRNRRRELRKALKATRPATKHSRESSGPPSATQTSTAAISAAPSSQSMCQKELESPLVARLAAQSSHVQAKVAQKPRRHAVEAATPLQSLSPHVETTTAPSLSVVAASLLPPESAPPLSPDIFAVPVSQPAQPRDAAGAQSSYAATCRSDSPNANRRHVSPRVVVARHGQKEKVTTAPPIRLDSRKQSTSGESNITGTAPSPGAQLAQELSASASDEPRARAGLPRIERPTSLVGKLPSRKYGPLTAKLAELCPPIQRLKPSVSSQPSQKRIVDYLTADDGAPAAKKLRTGRRHAAKPDGVEGPVLMSGGRSPGPSPSRRVEEVQVPSSALRSVKSQPSKPVVDGHEDRVLETQPVVISDDPLSYESSADDPPGAEPEQNCANAPEIVPDAEAPKASSAPHCDPSKSPLRPKYSAAKMSTGYSTSAVLPRDMPVVNSIQPSSNGKNPRPFIPKRTMAQYQKMVKTVFEERPDDRRTVEMVFDDLRTDDDMLNAVQRGDKEEIARLKTLKRRRKRERRELWGLPAKRRRQPNESLAAVAATVDDVDDDVEEVIREDDFTSEDESLASLYSGLEDEESEVADDDDNGDDFVNATELVRDRHISEVDREDDDDESLAAPNNGASRLGLAEGAIDAGVTKQDPLLSLHGSYQRNTLDKMVTAKTPPMKAALQPESTTQRAELNGFRLPSNLQPGDIPAPHSCAESIAGSEASSGLASTTSSNKRAKRRRDRAKVQAAKPDVARLIFKKPALPAKIRPGPTANREQKSATANGSKPLGASTKTVSNPPPPGSAAHTNAFGIDTRQFNLPSPIKRVVAHPPAPGARRMFPYESDDESIYSTPRSTTSRRA